MICRVALHEKPPGSVASDEARGFREWIKGLPGFVDGYHVQDSKTGRMLSITIWDSQESMDELKDLTPEGGSLGIRTDREEFFDVVEEYWGAAHRVYSAKCVEGRFSEVHLQTRA